MSEHSPKGPKKTNRAMLKLFKDELENLKTRVEAVETQVGVGVEPPPRKGDILKAAGIGEERGESDPNRYENT